MPHRLSTSLRPLAVFLALAAGAGATRLPAAAGEFQDFSELNLEALLNQVVVSAAKHEQVASESPVPVTVITAEEIAASGARSIPELLRDIPGMDPIMGSSADINISARGLNEVGANSMLVMIDGRSVYADFYGVTLWESLPLSLEEIKAIEVIKGPGSAFYGANAFSGVINIMTFAPEEIAGTLVSTTATSLGGSQSSVTHAGTRGDLGWRLSSGVGRSRNWETDMTELEMFRLNGHLGRRLAADSRVSLSAGHSNGTVGFVPSSAPLSLDGQTYFLRSDYSRGDLKVRWFWNRWALDVVPTDLDPLNELSVLASDVHDFEFQHALRPLPGHRLQWGGNYRFKSVDWTMQRQAQDQDIYSAFLYDEWRAGAHLLLSLGARWDDHPLVGSHVAPRGGLVWRPTPRHTLRGSYGVAYRDPTFLENFMYTELAGPFGTTQVVRGDADLESERMHAFEAGYQGLLSDGLLASVTMFRNEVDDLISIDVESTIPSPPAPVPGIPAVMAFQNQSGWILTGGEMTVDAVAASWLRIQAHWSYLWAEDADSGDHLDRSTRNSGGTTWTVFPEGRQSLFLTTRYRGGSAWVIGTTSGAVDKAAVEERWTLDLRWRYRSPAGRSRAVVGIDNILDERFRDHPLAIEQRRNVFASVGLEF